MRGRQIFHATAAAALLVTFQVGAYAADPEEEETKTETDPEVDRLEKEKKIYEAKEAMWKAREAASKAESAAATAKFGPLASVSNEGGVSFGKEGETAGKLEANLLAALATREAADRLAQRLCDTLTPGAGVRGRCNKAVAKLPEPKLTYDIEADATCEQRLTASDGLPTLVTMPQWDERPVVFLSEADNANFEVYESLMVRLTSLGKQMCNALDVAAQQSPNSELLLSRLRGKSGGSTAGGEGFVGGGGPGLAAIATAVDTVARLFETEYKVSDIALNEETMLLIKETMAAYKMRRPKSRIFAPELFPLTPVSPDNPIRLKLSAMDATLSEITTAAGEQRQLQNALTPFAEKAPKELQAAVNSAVDAHEANAKTLSDLAKAYTDLLVTLSTPAEGKSQLAVALRQAESAQSLKRGGVLALLKMNMRGATSFTKKNFFTAFGGMPFYVSGGAVASYAVMDGQSGEVLDSISVPIASGFQSVPEVHRSFRRRQARTSRD
ncbi:MAG TPA: hypothetical protein VF619_09980 [Allosphingosinicella sp.]|jgi:hypothetical protein